MNEMNGMNFLGIFICVFYLQVLLMFLFGWLVSRDFRKMGTCAAHEMVDGMIAGLIGFLWPIMFPIWKLFLRKKLERDLKEKWEKEAEEVCL